MAAQRSARKHFATHAHPGFAPRAYDHPPPTEPQSVPVRIVLVCDRGGQTVEGGVMGRGVGERA